MTSAALGVNARPGMSRSGTLTLRFLTSLALVACATFGAYVANGRLIGVDDAQIAFVYASHLASGEGFVYNAGGERVEGFTSLLWVLITSPLFRSSAAPEAQILLLTVMMTAATYTVGSRIAAGRHGSWLVYMLALLAWPAQVTWLTVSLMDTTLWSLLLTVAAALTLGARGRRADEIQFAIVMAGMVMARPESFLLCPSFILLRASRARALAIEGPRTLRSHALVPAVVFALAVLVLTVFRLAYFGHPLPNTFYAKVSPSLLHNLRGGLEYLRGFAAGAPLPALATACAAGSLLVAVWRLLRRGHDSLAQRLAAASCQDGLVLACISLTLLAAPVLAGGDHFVWWRMYQPAYPILVACLFVVIRESWTQWRPAPARSARRTLIWSALGAAAVVLAGYGNSSWLHLAASGESHLSNEFRIAHDGAEAGTLLHDIFAESALPSVGVVTAGGIKRTYPGVVMDMMGLNHSGMAHSSGQREGIRNHAAFNRDVFFLDPPDIVWPWPRLPSPGTPMPHEDTTTFVHQVLPGLFGDPRFRDEYRPAVLCRGVESHVCVTAYFRTQLLARIERSGGYHLRVLPWTTASP